MIAEAIEKICSLATPTIQKIGGKVYADTPMDLIDEEKPHARQISLTSLESICTMVQAEAVKKEDETVYVRVISPTKVDVFTGLDEDRDRECLYYCEAETPSINMLRTAVSHETACIELRTLFMPTDECTGLVDLLSRITEGSEATTADDGISQQITVTRGISLKENVKVKPRVMLTPYRTFIEVDQPASEFLLRVSGNNEIRLIPADGDIWKLEATRNVAAYLKKQLEKEIESGFVVVVR